MKDAQERLHNILNAMDEGITLAGLDGRVLDCNDTSLKMLGLTREEFIGKDVYEIVVPEDRQNAMAGALKVLETGKHLTEVGVLRKNGSTFCAEISVTALYDKNGKPISFLGVVRDISERKKIDNEIRQSEQLYRTLFDNSDDAFVLLEPIYNANGETSDFRFLKVNRAYERQTGRRGTVVEGKRAREVAADLEQEWISLVGRVAKSGKSVRYENFNRHTSKWYDAFYFPFAKRQVGILFRDITERKKAEEALQIREERYRSLANSLPEIVFETDINGKVVFANERGFEITGYTQKDLDKGFDVFSLVAPEDKEKAIERFSKALNNQPSFNNEFTVVRKDGSTFPAIVVTSLIVENQRPIGLRGLAIDITERKKLEKQLQDQERLASIGATAGMVGHDIRNPLQTIVGDTFLLRSELTNLSKCKSKESMVESLDSIDKNVEYINKIVQDLQDYARPVVPVAQETNFKSVIADILVKKAIPKNIEAAFDIQADASRVITDPSLLKRILTNLVNNAVQAMPDGGKLTIRIYRDRDHIILTVEDSGAGIPEEIKQKIFTPLFTTKPKGQGFGLAVVKRMTEALGGTVTFESQVGKGTKFIVELPLKLQPEVKPTF